MARARNIKPGFFRNEALAECSPWARLMFAGLWTLADRDGRLEDRPKRIKVDLFPYDAEVDVERHLDDLSERGSIARYEVGQQRLIQIINFAKHQTPHHREAVGTLPAMSSPGSAQGSVEATSEAEPETSPGLAQVEPVPSRADSLIPDSLIPEVAEVGTSAAAGSADDGAGEAARATSATAKKTKGSERPNAEAVTNPVWDAYAEAYERRYGAAPVRNAKINGQLKQLVERLGLGEAPLVATYYLEDTRPFYLGCTHALGPLLQDAEALRTRWAVSQRSAPAEKSMWLEEAGFTSAFEAETAGCGPGNAKQFRDGRKVVA